MASAAEVALGVSGRAVEKATALVAQVGQPLGPIFCCGGWLTWQGQEGDEEVGARVHCGDVEMERLVRIWLVPRSYWKGAWTR